MSGDRLEAGWYVVEGKGHLFLNPGPHPACRLELPDGDYQRMAKGDPVCPECDRYVYEVYLPQIG